MSGKRCADRILRRPEEIDSVARSADQSLNGCAVTGKGRIEIDMGVWRRHRTRLTHSIQKSWIEIDLILYQGGAHFIPCGFKFGLILLVQPCQFARAPLGFLNNLEQIQPRSEIRDVRTLVARRAKQGPSPHMPRIRIGSELR